MAAAVTAKISTFFTGDILFLAIIFVIFLLYAMYLGRSRMISLILSFYPTTLLFKTFPFMDKVKVGGVQMQVLIQLGLFLVLLVPINLIISKYMFSDLIHVRSSNIIQTIGLSLVAVLMVVILYYNTIDFGALHQFSPTIDTLFVGSDKTFWWNLVPFVLLAFL